MKTKAKILVVDDDLDFIEISKLSLEGQGYQVLAAFNAKEGWKMVEKRKPDLIIMDLMMERLDSGMALVSRSKIIRNMPPSPFSCLLPFRAIRGWTSPHGRGKI